MKGSTGHRVIGRDGQSPGFSCGLRVGVPGMAR
jgi:hypothetical protein